MLKMHKHSNRYLLVAFTILALLFVQLLPLHMHLPHTHAAASESASHVHSHHDEIHISYSDLSSDAHGKATSFDIFGKAIIKYSKCCEAFLAILIAAVILLLQPVVLTLKLPWIPYIPLTSRDRSLIPPLRAPPV